MNLAALRERVRDLTDMRQVTLAPDATVDAYLNETAAEVLGAREWPFLEQAATYQTAAAVVPLTAAGVRALVSVVCDDATAAVELSPLTAQAAADAAYAAAAGSPRWYYFDRDHDQVRLYPSPTGTVSVTVRTISRPPVLAADTDEPPFDVEYHPVLAYGAAVRLLARESDTSGRMGAYQAEYTSMVKRMMADYMTNDDRSPLVIGGRRDRRRGLRATGWGARP